MMGVCDGVFVWFTRVISSPGYHAVTACHQVRCRAIYSLLEWSLRLTIGRIGLSVSTVNRTYELSGITHVTPFRKYGIHSTGPSTTRTLSPCTYSKLFSCKSILTICSYRAQLNETFTYGKVPRGSLPRVRRYHWLYLENRIRPLIP